MMLLLEANPSAQPSQQARPVHAPSSSAAGFCAAVVYPGLQEE